MLYLELRDFTDQLFFDLIQLLTIKIDDFIMYEPQNHYLPCWIESEEESKMSFQETIEKLKQWSREMSEQILNLRYKSSMIWVRCSGNF